MIAMIWTLFGVLLMIWTASAWAAAEFVAWAAQGLQSSAGARLFDSTAGMAALPGWMAEWIGPDLLHGALATFRWSAGTLESTLPWAGGAVGLIVPLVWAGWFIVAALLAVAAIAMHVLVRHAKGSFRAQDLQSRPGA